MPLPVPEQKEAREEFLDRCLLDPDAKAQYPDSGNRFAFCQSRWENTVRKNDEPRTLYISRAVLNADDLISWGKRQGFETMYSPEDMHVTVADSSRPLDWFSIPNTVRQITIPAGGPRVVQALGDKGAVVLRFSAPMLASRFQEIMEQGASWNYPTYKPHITLTLNANNVDLSRVEPYAGPIVLGQEKFAEVKENWMDGRTEKFEVKATIEKLDQELRIAYGWFSVVEEGGKPVVDHHNDVITEETILMAAHKYMMESRAGKVMHGGKRVADVVESIVFTKDLQKALNIDLGRVGWFGGMKFRDDETWKQVKAGKLPEFSIGGFATKKPLAG